MWGVMRARLPLRLARSVFFTVVCVLLAAAAHRLGGGVLPSLKTVLAAGAVVLAFTIALAGRERSAPTISVLLAVAQLFLHELFDRVTPAVATSSSFLSAHGHSGLGPDLGMLIAHLTATLITGWWLARGESALWALLRRAGARVTGSLRVLLSLIRGDLGAPAAPLSWRFPATVSPLRPRRGLRHAVTRRGPPLPAGLCTFVRAAGTTPA
ncbi:hypothetical protein Pth03_07150 [Planotetraspora thailandica]|uniref:Uncharacterized protein n=1 Tax=Planotetraspora thailandica TaxID=487172 RepID=A0A8J3XU61_9ACTN|nr:MFS transporter [Planotetraspora thailandica]GII52326.1 hypothetical protein Pth03_07150 [Planotetraspora thailandica]